MYKIQVVSNTLSTTTANGTFYETIGALINIKTISNAELLPFFLSLYCICSPFFAYFIFIHLVRIVFFIYSFNACLESGEGGKSGILNGSFITGHLIFN